MIKENHQHKMSKRRRRPKQEPQIKNSILSTLMTLSIHTTMILGIVLLIALVLFQIYMPPLNANVVAAALFLFGISLMPLFILAWIQAIQEKILMMKAHARFKRMIYQPPLPDDYTIGDDGEIIDLKEKTKRS